MLTLSLSLLQVSDCGKKFILGGEKVAVLNRAGADDACGKASSGLSVVVGR